jgi:DNA mismatch repair protein MutS2
MTFAPGDAVHVAGLGKGIVREVRNGRRYLVELKRRSIVAHEGQLTGVTQRSPAADVSSSARPAAVDPPPARSSLDLHGMTVEEAGGALDEFLNDALLAGVPEVRVIHGRSGGRLKAAVHARLTELPVVRGWRLDPGNAGVTIVSL